MTTNHTFSQTAVFSVPSEADSLAKPGETLLEAAFRIGLTTCFRNGAFFGPQDTLQSVAVSIGEQSPRFVSIRPAPDGRKVWQFKL